MSTAQPLVRVQNLKKYFSARAGVFSKVVGRIKAVDDISFSIATGETFGLVGESGCGKSTTGRTLLNLLSPTEGEVYFKNQNIFKLKKYQLRNLRREMQIIFQDPYGSLNPRLTIGEAIGESLEEHGIARGKEKKERVENMLAVCGLSPYHYCRYPHEFSGGQRQRVGIARALVLNPQFIVADEPISGLDLSIQAHLINLLKNLQAEFGLTFLFISHDLNVVKHICDRVAVMYLGRLTELAPKKELYTNPLHPYTKALLSAVPVMDPAERKERIILIGDAPSSADPPDGCRFHPRCRYKVNVCQEQIPELREVSAAHFVACHLV